LINVVTFSSGASELGAAFDRNQNDPNDFKSVVRVILHYIKNKQP